jgi:glutamate transport system substrate-binding protein
MGIRPARGAGGHVHLRVWKTTAIAGAIALAAGGCVTVSPIANTGDFPVASGVTVAGSQTFSAMASQKKIIIGVKNDQPGIGYYDPQTKSYSGFDIEIAELIAAGLGFGLSEIQFIPIESIDRETALENGSVDMVVASYSYTTARAQEVSFAGPYFETNEGLLIRSNETSVTKMSSLTPADNVCSAADSTPLQQLPTLTDAHVVALGSYSQCVDKLLANQVDGVYTDLAIDAGYAAQDPGRLKVIPVNAAQTQYYGIGVQFGESNLVAKIDQILSAAEADGTWKAIFNATLAPSGIRPVIPPISQWPSAAS